MTLVYPWGHGQMRDRQSASVSIPATPTVRTPSIPTRYHEQRLSESAHGRRPDSPGLSVGPLRPPGFPGGHGAGRFRVAGWGRIAAASSLPPRRRFPVLRGGRNRGQAPVATTRPRLGNRHSRPARPPSPGPRAVRRCLPISLGRPCAHGGVEPLRPRARRRGARGHPHPVARRDQPSRHADHLPAAGSAAVPAGEPGGGDGAHREACLALLRPGVRVASARDRRPDGAQPRERADLVPLVAPADRRNGVERALRCGGAVPGGGADPVGGGRTGRGARARRFARPEHRPPLEEFRSPRVSRGPGRPCEVRSSRRIAARGTPLRRLRGGRLRRHLRGILPAVHGCRPGRSHRGTADLCAALVGE